MTAVSYHSYRELNECIGDDTKAALAEVQTALGKQVVRSMERWYLFCCRNSMKNGSIPTQTFTESGQSAAKL